MYEHNHWIVLFDLENCLIEHWDNPRLINIEEIRYFLSEVWEWDYTYTYGIYSYALWRDVNRQIVLDKIVPKLEEEFDISFDPEYVFPTAEIIQDFANKRNPIDYAAYCSVISKQNSLMEFQRNNPKFSQCSIALVDPTVTHGMNVFIPGGNTMIFINSNNLGDFIRPQN